MIWTRLNRPYCVLPMLECGWSQWCNRRLCPLNLRRDQFCTIVFITHTSRYHVILTSRYDANRFCWLFKLIWRSVKVDVVIALASQQHWIEYFIHHAIATNWYKPWFKFCFNLDLTIIEGSRSCLYMNWWDTAILKAQASVAINLIGVRSAKNWNLWPCQVQIIFTYTYGKFKKFSKLLCSQVNCDFIFLNWEKR